MACHEPQPAKFRYGLLPNASHLLRSDRCAEPSHQGVSVNELKKKLGTEPALAQKSSVKNSRQFDYRVLMADNSGQSYRIRKMYCTQCSHLAKEPES
jgi:hypothetical protein